MSYLTFQQRCKNCDKHWNAAFGIVGTTYVAQPPQVCPHCGSSEIEYYKDHWDIVPVQETPLLEKKDP